MVRQHEQVAYFASGLPIFVHAEDDGVGQRIVAAQLMELGLAQQDELSAALGVHRSTLYASTSSSAARGCWGWWRPSGGPTAPIASPPTSVGASSSCWARAGRCARRRAKWASAKE